MSRKLLILKKDGNINNNNNVLTIVVINNSCIEYGSWNIYNKINYECFQDPVSIK